jgi:hypothetical protein
VSILSDRQGDYISLTDMLRAKDGEFFISDWLRNRNTVEFLGIWESIFNPGFNYGEFATIRSQAGLNSYKISVKEWVEKTNAIESNCHPPDADPHCAYGDTAASIAEKGKGMTAKRYATPLPQLTGEVATLAARVDGHLQKMGFA